MTAPPNPFVLFLAATLLSPVWMIALALREIARSLKDFPMLVAYCRSPYVNVAPVVIHMETDEERKRREQMPLTCVARPAEPSEEFGKGAKTPEPAV